MKEKAGADELLHYPGVGSLIRRGEQWWGTCEARLNRVGIDPNSDFMQPTVGPFSSSKEAGKAYMAARSQTPMWKDMYRLHARIVNITASGSYVLADVPEDIASAEMCMLVDGTVDIYVALEKRGDQWFGIPVQGVSPPGTHVD